MRSELSSPETVYAELARAATGAVNNVQDFAAAIRDPALQGLLTHAKESKDENPEGVAGWLATQHEDWLDPVSLGVETKIKIEDGLDGIGAMEEKGWSKEEVVEAFKKAHPTVNVEIEAGGEIKVCRRYIYEFVYDAKRTGLPTFACEDNIPNQRRSFERGDLVCVQSVLRRDGQGREADETCCWCNTSFC